MQGGGIAGPRAGGRCRGWLLRRRLAGVSGGIGIGISRLEQPLTDMQRKGVQLSSHQRLGIYYDTGFNLYSSGQFCSRFVHEILYEATGVSVGKPETLKELLDKNPEADIAFWRMWYFGRIPWERKTITPASLWQSAQLHSVFDGYAT